MANKIFVVEDDISICEMVDNYLVSEDFRVNVFHSGFEAIRAFQLNTDYALALIDLMLPDTSGMEVIKAIRQISKVPIIIITAKDNDTDKSMGLNLGADDYVVKPFKLGELGARVEAHLRRESRGDSGLSAKFFDNLTINFNKRQVSYQDKVIPFTKKEFDIVELLTRNPGQVFDKERIYELIWGYDGDGNSSIIVEHIRRIRKKFMEYTERNYIETVWGIGYKWEN